MKAAITYEILGYKTKEDFTKRNSVVLDIYITRKREAVKIGKKLYNSEPYYKVIKVQSSDREFILILDE